ncbi:hypothetical protein [Pseudomonas sp.]|uniref:hypothetical protein n=1 Tax=Pseudomonas sp. TaxID=306 RepID=UPI003D0BCF8A
MSEQSKPGAGMGDMIGATRQRLDATPDPASRLKELVAATPLPVRTAAPVTDVPGRLPPTNYFPQVPQAPEVAVVTPKRSPKKGPTRSQHVTMRLSAPERQRLVQWCEDRNLSLADGVMALLDLAESSAGSE